MEHCRLCGVKTKNGFNIDFKLVPICEKCANSVMLQQAVALTQPKVKSKK